MFRHHPTDRCCEQNLGTNPALSQSLFSEMIRASSRKTSISRGLYSSDWITGSFCFAQTTMWRPFFSSFNKVTSIPRSTQRNHSRPWSFRLISGMWTKVMLHRLAEWQPRMLGKQHHLGFASPVISAVQQLHNILFGGHTSSLNDWEIQQWPPPVELDLPSNMNLAWRSHHPLLMFDVSRGRVAGSMATLIVAGQLPKQSAGMVLSWFRGALNSWLPMVWSGLHVVIVLSTGDDGWYLLMLLGLAPVIMVDNASLACWIW